MSSGLGWRSDLGACVPLGRQSAETESRTLTADELQILARYNAEVSRGLVHTGRWQVWMRELQQRFDAGVRAQFDGQEARAQDSPRWCDRCQKYGDHHTDRCELYDGERDG